MFGEKLLMIGSYWKVEVNGIQQSSTIQQTIDDLEKLYQITQFFLMSVKVAGAGSSERSSERQCHFVEPTNDGNTSLPLDQFKG